MEKLADNEIIKALECCNSTERGHCLNKCPYYNYSANCIRTMINDALDLINRQKAEIERLKSEAECAEGYADALEERAKSEAYREFAEKLKENTLEVDVSYGYGKEHYTGVVAVVEIDNTLKELTRNLHGTCTETTDQTATNHSVSLIDGHIEG